MQAEECVSVRVYKYDVAGVMVNVEDKHDRIYADTELWFRASDLEQAYQKESKTIIS